MAHGQPSMPSLSGPKLKPLVVDAFVEVGVGPVAAEHVASSTIEASLRGVDSHGIKLLPHYHRAVQAGRVNARPQIQTTFPAASVALIDADHAVGHHAGAVAVDTATDLA